MFSWMGNLKKNEIAYPLRSSKIYGRILLSHKTLIFESPLNTRITSSFPPLFPYFPYFLLHTGFFDTFAECLTNQNDNMEVEYRNLYTHFVFTTQDRFPCISEKHRERIEKYITGIINRRGCRLYAIYANPEHVHFLVSRDPAMSEKQLAETVANASEIFRTPYLPHENQAFADMIGII